MQGLCLEKTARGRSDVAGAVFSSPLPAVRDIKIRPLIRGAGSECRLCRLFFFVVCFATSTKRLVEVHNTLNFAETIRNL